MSAEYFDTLGLIICGYNASNDSTDIYWYDTKTTNWANLKLQNDTRKIGNKYIACKIINLSPQEFYLVLMGG
jgi:hypothetical protein